MNDEINKIIQSINDFYKLDNALKYYLDRHKAQIILDCITNLQQERDNLILENQRLKEAVDIEVQENERLKEELEEETLNKEIAQGHRKQVQDIELQERHELEDYKSRCEKADNQLMIIKQIMLEQPTRNVEDDEWLQERLTGVQNILQNGSDSE